MICHCKTTSKGACTNVALVRGIAEKFRQVAPALGQSNVSAGYVVLARGISQVFQAPPPLLLPNRNSLFALLRRPRVAGAALKKNLGNLRPVTFSAPRLQTTSSRGNLSQQNTQKRYQARRFCSPFSRLPILSDFASETLCSMTISKRRNRH